MKTLPLLLIMVSVGCSSGSKSKSSASATSTAAVSSSAPAGSGAAAPASEEQKAPTGPKDPSKLTLTYTGKNDKDNKLLITFANETTRTVHWAFVGVYAYDKKKKQLKFSDGRMFKTAGYVFEPDLKAAQTKDEWSNDFGKDDLPDGTVTVQMIALQIEDPKQDKFYRIDPPEKRAQN